MDTIRSNKLINSKKIRTANFLTYSTTIHTNQFCTDTTERSTYQTHTVYPTKYAHGFVVLCFVVVMQSFIMNSHEELPQCRWSKPDGYGKISQCITTTKHSKAKTVCTFLGIYCMLLLNSFADSIWCTTNSVRFCVTGGLSVPSINWIVFRKHEISQLRTLAQEAGVSGRVIGIDTNIEVVNETTMTEIEVSISSLSWWNWINDE